MPDTFSLSSFRLSPSCCFDSFIVTAPIVRTFFQTIKRRTAPFSKGRIRLVPDLKLTKADRIRRYCTDVTFRHRPVPLPSNFRDGQSSPCSSRHTIIVPRQERKCHGLFDSFLMFLLLERTMLFHNPCFFVTIYATFIGYVKILENRKALPEQGFL